VVETLAIVAAVALCAIGEWLHQARVRRVAGLAFGPTGRPRAFARLAPLVRTLAFAALAFGFATLLQLEPKVHQTGALKDSEVQHLVLVLDVSPSMRLVDAGPNRQQSRMQRARDVMESFFRRVPVEQYRISVVATYNGAKPVVVDTSDLEVVRNILGDLPMHYAFPSGRTDIFAGLTEAAKIAEKWRPKSAVVALVSDGDSVPALGMPKMPASVRKVLVVGVGDPTTGKFLDGHLSRQDRSTLRQVAVRLSGVYHDGNLQHLSTETLELLTNSTGESAIEKLTRREYALLAIALGASLLAFLPVLLHRVGTGWRPGVQDARLLADARGRDAAASPRAG
jgi:Ca-activated chloride channel family protein